jgi:filamentous hemagglutinin
VPEVGAQKAYTPDETVELITNYRNTHAAEYADNSINVVNLKGVYTGDITNKYASFYEKNLAVTPVLSDLLSGTLSGIGLGEGNAWSGAYGAAWGLLSDPAGTSDQLVNGVVGLSKNSWGSFMDITEANQTKSAMAILYDMQGNSEASAAIRAQSDIEFVLNFLPANRAKTLAELGAGRKLESVGPCNGDCRPVSVAGEGAKATGAAEVPATSATARVGLREDLAAQAGIPRNMVEAPANVWGKSIDDIQQSFKMDGAKLTYVPPKTGTSGNAQVYKVEGGTTGIKEIQYSPSTVDASVKSVHVGEYYKITYVDGSKAKVIDPATYRPTFQVSSKPIYDANTTYLNPQGQKVKFNPATNAWISE